LSSLTSITTRRWWKSTCVAATWRGVHGLEHVVDHLPERRADALDRRRFGTQSRVWIFEDGELRHSFENTAKVMSRLNLMIDNGPLDSRHLPAEWRD
jgi:hypothetical protein